MKAVLDMCVSWALVVGLAGSVRAQEDRSSTLTLRGDPRLEPLIQELRGSILEALESRGVPGLAIALVDGDGTLWSEGFGETARERGHPVDTETLFSVQSISKSLTATGVLMAVRDGKVDLDEPVTTYLPDFTVQSRFEERPERRITLRHLLSHHAGLTHEAPIGNNYDPSFPSFEAYIESISRTWLRYPVGQRYSYSNLGLDLAGYVLQVVSGQPFATYMREAVLRPLGMERSSFDWTTIRAAENRAIGHAEGHDSVPLEFGLIPSGAFYASVEDMAKFVRFHLNRGRVDGRQIVPLPILREMYTLQFPVEGQRMGYGLGLGRYERFGTYLHNHGGGGFGFQADMSWYPTYGIGVVVLTNSTGYNLASRFSGSVMNRLLELELGEVPSGGGGAAGPELTPVAVEAAAANRVLGHYVGRGLELKIVMKGDSLGVDFRGRFAPLRFLSDDEAYVQVGPTTQRLRFVFDEGGRPACIVGVDVGQYLDYNDGPHDPPGPDDPRWSMYEGDYTYTIWGSESVDNEVRRDNGYLYFNEWRLEEHLPGLFFSTTGEALDFRGEVPTWRNIQLSRSSPGSR